MKAKRVGTFDTYEEAEEVRKEYEARGYKPWGVEGHMQVKVQRVGQYLDQFTVKVRSNPNSLRDSEPGGALRWEKQKRKSRREADATKVRETPCGVPVNGGVE